MIQSWVIEMMKFTIYFVIIPDSIAEIISFGTKLINIEKKPKDPINNSNNPETIYDPISSWKVN